MILLGSLDVWSPLPALPEAALGAGRAAVADYALGAVVFAPASRSGIAGHGPLTTLVASGISCALLLPRRRGRSLDAGAARA